MANDKNFKVKNEIQTAGGNSTNWQTAYNWGDHSLAGYLDSSTIGSTVQAYDVDIPTISASQAEMEAGTETALRSMSPLRVKQAIDALGGGSTGIGIGQTWQTVTRSSGVSYQNTTGKPIMCYIYINPSAYDVNCVQVSSNGSSWIGVGAENSSSGAVNQFIVPVNHYYRVNGATINQWTELR